MKHTTYSDGFKLQLGEFVVEWREASRSGGLQGEVYFSKYHGLSFSVLAVVSRWSLQVRRSPVRGWVRG